MYVCGRGGISCARLQPATHGGHSGYNIGGSDKDIHSQVQAGEWAFLPEPILVCMFVLYYSSHLIRVGTISRFTEKKLVLCACVFCSSL